LPQDRPVTLAVIIGAHGVAGEVRLKLFTDDVESVKAHTIFNGGSLTLKSLRPGNSIIARFAEIADRTAAETARGTELTVPRSALPPLAEGEYYHADLMGLSCFSTESLSVGICVAVENFGAGDVLEIEDAAGKRFMIPVSAAEIQTDKIIIDSIFVPV
jgi:16S rRNA processing protein RimM